MTLPSKAKQVEAVMKFLDSDYQEGRSLEEIATAIVEGYHDALVKGLKKPATPVRRGMLFKSPLDSKVRRIAYLNDATGEVWIVADTSSYGWLGLSPALLEYSEEYVPSKMVPTGEVDAEGKIKKKRVEMTPEEIEEAWSNPDFKVGDQLSQHQREFTFEIIAVAPECALLISLQSGRIYADSNQNLKQYYKREIKGAAEW